MSEDGELWCPFCAQYVPDGHEHTWYSMREKIAQLEAENADLLARLDEAIAWHEGDDSPRARLETENEILKKAIKGDADELA